MVRLVRNANEGVGCRSPDTTELFAPGLALIELCTTCKTLQDGHVIK